MPSGISKSSFGHTGDGTPVDLYTLTNSAGMIARITNYGAIITELHAPDRAGKFADVVLGFDQLDGYLKRHPYFGALVGRFANRIAKGQFTLNAKQYSVAVNKPPNHLHGGVKGYDKKIWKAEPLTKDGAPALKLTYLSHDGDEGYPGKLDVTVVYTITNDNALRIDYTATPGDLATPVNLTQHSYFNLAGAQSNVDVLGHEMTLFADHFTPVDAALIPTGEIEAVRGTPMDFTKPMPIGSRIAQIGNDPVGYDHNYVINGGGTSLAPTAHVYEPTTGRVMDVLTTQPGVQFYTANFFDGSIISKGGIVCKKYFGFCLETQHFPDSVNRPNFPSAIVNPGQTYNQTTVYRFSTRGTQVK